MLNENGRTNYLCEVSFPAIKLPRKHLQSLTWYIRCELIATMQNHNDIYPVFSDIWMSIALPSDSNDQLIFIFKFLLKYKGRPDKRWSMLSRVFIRKVELETYIIFYRYSNVIFFLENQFSLIILKKQFNGLYDITIIPRVSDWYKFKRFRKKKYVHYLSKCMQF